MPTSLYNTQFRANVTPAGSLPIVSTQLDSVRAYQFEVKFYNIPTAGQLPEITDLTLAAKQVNAFGGEIQDIVVDRINDKLYYPGKFQATDLTITFDNLYLKNTSLTLWNWFKSIYDPITGNMTQLTAPAGQNATFKSNRMTILELDNAKNPIASIELYGAYPKKVNFSEKNYSQNAFSTIEVTFRYDFIDYSRSTGSSSLGSTLGALLR